MATRAGYGTWRSPLTAARVAAGALRFDHLVADGNHLYWVEGRASEAGRYVVVRRAPGGGITDVTPAGFNVRTRVNEYGGAAYTVHDGTVFFANFADQRLYRQDGSGEPRPLTAAGCFYADARVDAARRRLIAVREDHRVEGEPVQTLVSVALDGGDEVVLVSGADFYSDPIVSPDGAALAWLEWRHPNMPWDGTELWLAPFLPDGSLGERTLVAGGRDESIFQPEWSPDGRLVYVSDRTGWWNLYLAPAAASAAALAAGGSVAAGHDVALLPMQAEFGKPQWTFSQSTYCFIDARTIAATYTEHGHWKLGLLDLDRRRFTPVALPIEPTDGVCAVGGELFCIGGSPTQPPSVASIQLTDAGGSGEVEILRAATADPVPHEWISRAQPITFPSEDREVHAFYYAPHNPEFTAPDDELPPLIVVSHGGPTAARTDVLEPGIQYWTSRGFAVLDVNYTGSTGFGRAYRDRLKGAWGLADVADCVNGARHLVALGLADRRRLAIRGGSAGGYTTLAALTFHDVFTAGASYYGVSDLEVLARDTHKFESRYLDSLVGPYPQARDVYVARSPIHFADRLNAALILFQGLEDKVVPPNQSEMMAEAVRRKGLPVAYIPFAGEQHGFRRAENIIRSLEAELFFYGAVFRFQPADVIEPVTIDNLPT